MKVTFEKLPCVKKVSFNGVEKEIPQDSGWERVLVDGRQIGLVPSDIKDPNYRVLHPLSGFPNELADEIIEASNGRLERALVQVAPLPEPEEQEQEDFE